MNNNDGLSDLLSSQSWNRFKMYKLHIRIAITVLLFLVNIAYSKRKIKEEDDELLTEETVTYLHELTNKIDNCLEYPSSDNGTILFRSLYEYYNELHGIYWMMRDKVKRDKVIDFVQKIIDRGLPVHLKKAINFGDSKDKFLWNDIIVQEVNDLIKDTKTLWKNCKSLL